ncbi:uncharacterized protein PFL1_05478 [Pseudozyma flocculosa PF-1]|nr:uncharacterized protein PFL1_05478 [Pseudozyma flocculosa PF-1]EPQ26843.1 hypothetical protein PFL1_05478 [Pseudozyma flocculosa PF-1]
MERNPCPICVIGVHCLDANNVAGVSFDFSIEQGSGVGMGEALADGERQDHILGLFGPDMEAVFNREEFGSASIGQGQYLAFPATLSTKMDPVKLLDAKRPGHLTLVRFWLVDPSDSVVSTARVVPQQVDWVKEAMRGMQRDPKSLFSLLPIEVLEMIFDELEELLEANERGLRKRNKTKCALRLEDQARASESAKPEFTMSTRLALKNRNDFADRLEKELYDSAD